MLGLNTTKEDPENPLDAVLSMRGGGGRWSGIYQDGREPVEWSRVGTTSASAVAANKAWAGVFSEDDLSPSTSGADTTFVWSVDPSRIIEGGKLVVSISQWSGAAGAFVRVRDVELAAPDFDLEAATAVGQDLDGDGISELIVEAWGAGGHDAWVIRSATDKAATAPPVHLTSWVQGEHVALASFPLDGEGPVVARSTMAVGDAGLCSTTRTLEFARADGGPPQGTVKEECWDVLSAFDVDALEASPALSGSIGEEVWADQTDDIAARGDTRGNGVCHYGKCWCVPGWRGVGGKVAGEGSAAETDAAPVAPGDVALLSSDDSGASLVVTRAVPIAARLSGPILSILESEEVSGVLHESGSADGTWLTRGDTPLFTIEPGDLIDHSLQNDDSDDVFFQWKGSAETSDATGDFPVVTTVTAGLRVRYADQSSPRLVVPTGTASVASAPHVLDTEDGGGSEDKGYLVGWRDTDGQAWLGVLSRRDVLAQAEGDLAFAQGPVAVGRPLLDPDGTLGLGPTDGGMVAVDVSIGTDAPWLTIEDPADRFSDWDEPMEVPFDAGEGAYGPVVLVVGADDGTAQTVLVPRFDHLTAVGERTLHASEDPAALPVPRIAARLLPDAPQVVVSTTAAGDVALTGVDGVGNFALEPQYTAYTTDYTGGVTVASGDFNGDGLGDLLLGAGSTTTVALSDGAGGVLDDPGPEAAMFTNFGVLLGGSSGGRQSCDDDDDYILGVGGQPRGRTKYGSITLERSYP